MKKLLPILLITFCFLAKQNFSQKDSLLAKFNGNCLISGGSISLSDYKNLKIICPPKLTKVIRFKRMHQPKGTHRKNAYPVYFEGNVETLLIFPEAKPGDMVILDEIIGLGHDKKRAVADGMVLIIK
jgi:hypothetical protein